MNQLDPSSTVPGEQSRTASRARPTNGSRGSALPLAGLSFALGAALLLAPSTMARLIGARPTRTTRNVLSAIGLREVAVAGGLVGARRAPAAWTWLRAGGDAMDLALLAAASKQRRINSPRLARAAAIVGGVMLADVMAALAQSR